MTNEVINTVAKEAITENAVTTATTTIGGTNPMRLEFNAKNILTVGVYGLVMGAGVAAGQYVVVKVVEYFENPERKAKRQQKKADSEAKRQQKKADREAKKAKKEALKKGIILDPEVEETNEDED